MKGTPIWLTFVIAMLLVVPTIVYGFRLHDLSGQLDQAKTELAQVSAKAAGAHRDLITCADLQGLGLTTLLDIGLNTNADGSLSAVPDEQPVQLPSHCINQ